MSRLWSVVVVAVLAAAWAWVDRRHLPVEVSMSEPVWYEPIGLDALVATFESDAPHLDPEERAMLAWVVAVAADVEGLSRSLVMAVMRAESDFRFDVVSSRGAIGYMQVRPATLAFLAARAGDRRSLDELLTDRFAQIHLAVAYLASLQRSFAGRQSLALMAYNAGPRALNDRLKANDIDSLRPYVEKVQVYRARYEALLVEHQAALAAVQPPSTLPIQ